MAESADNVVPLNGSNENASEPSFQRSNSISQASDISQTAQEFISSQLQLEADAREALPYQFDTCTRPLGPLRQLLFSCLTCNPPPESPSESYYSAGVCYSCSISCHGEHILVELFNKRDFVCDCGTTRLPETSPCTLRVNEVTGANGGIHSEKAAEGNKYNQNFKNRFCGCSENYDAHSEKGTMFQCLGLGTVADGGCGEDWWHAECIVGLPRGWYTKDAAIIAKAETNGTANGDALQSVPDDVEMTGQPDEDPPLPPGFPEEDDFEAFICYKCVEAFPWIKRYADTEAFLPAVFYQNQQNGENKLSDKEKSAPTTEEKQTEAEALDASLSTESHTESRKRKASNEPEDTTEGASKRQRSSSIPASKESTTGTSQCSYIKLPPAPSGPFSLFLKPDFRSTLCRCPTHFPLLLPHAPLLDEEETYEPPISEDGSDAVSHGNGTGSVGSRSLLDRGEAALSNMDRVRAIEGVMVYNHLKDKVKGFLKPFADSGVPVGAEDIKRYFETLRGDAEALQALRTTQAQDAGGDGGSEGDSRREQGGY